MVQILKDAGACVNFPDRKGNSAIHLAATRKDVDMLKLLSKFTAPLPDINAKNFAGLLIKYPHVLCKSCLNQMEGHCQGLNFKCILRFQTIHQSSPSWMFDIMILDCLRVKRVTRNVKTSLCTLGTVDSKTVL